MESLKNITTNRFDTNNEDLVTMLPYILEEKETGKRMISSQVHIIGTHCRTCCGSRTRYIGLLVFCF